jgi:hypothetical protein
MKRNSGSSDTDDEYQLIYSNLPQLPDPPPDLPIPWDFRKWQPWFFFGFFVALFGLRLLGSIFQIEYLDLGGACVWSWGIFLFLGIFLVILFSNRGYRENYSYWANPTLFKSIKRYRKKKPREAYFSLFPKYLIKQQEYFLVWYVPGTGAPSVRNLSPGAEPILFNKSGEPLDDPDLFSKVFLMWSYGLDISPGNFKYQLTKDLNTLKKLGDQHLPPLPRLLELNSTLIEDLGLSPELKMVNTTYPIKYALYNHTIDTMEKKAIWADFHGWDSLTQLRYQDFLSYHEANVELVNARKLLIEQYSIGVAESAARKLRDTIQTQSGRWIERSQLIDSLEAFSVPLPTGEIHFKQELDGSWKPPEEILAAYRSRLEYVKTLDANEQKLK